MHILVDHRTPADEAIANEEGEKIDNPFRDAARKFAFIMNRAMIFITDAENKALAAWQVSLALGLPVCEGKTYTIIGSISGGVCRAAVGKGATHFCDMCGLPPSLYMKRESARKAYRTSRIKAINERNQQIDSRAG